MRSEQRRRLQRLAEPDRPIGKTTRGLRPSQDASYVPGYAQLDTEETEAVWRSPAGDDSAEARQGA